MIDSILLAMPSTVKEVIPYFVEYGYLLVFLFMVIESSFIPFPSEIVVPPAVYLACTAGPDANMNPYLVVLIATLGALVGAYINYYLALWIGRPVVYRFADSRFGHMCLIDRAKVEKAEKYFEKHGAVSTVIGRLIPAIRQLISIPAGLARMNIVLFTLFTFLGALVWNVILGLLGYWLSLTVPLAQLDATVEKYNQYLTWGGLGLLVLCILYIVYKALRHKKTQE